jgi:hypothetical protein
VVLADVGVDSPQLEQRASPVVQNAYLGVAPAVEAA